MLPFLSVLYNIVVFFRFQKGHLILTRFKVIIAKISTSETHLSAKICFQALPVHNFHMDLPAVRKNRAFYSVNFTS